MPAAPFMNIAHRGFSARYPENTRLAFQKALDLGVTWVEFDLQVTRDGRLVVIHDRTVDRTTDGTGPVSGLSFSQTQALDAGIRLGPEFVGLRIPTFEETLDLLSGRARMAIELKFEGTAPIARALGTLKDRNLLDDVSITSFDLAKFPEVKSRCPGVSTTALIKQDRTPVEEWVRRVRALNVDTYGPRAGETTQETVDRAHEIGLIVRAWGLGRDQGPEMERLIDLGVDGMTTDCPDILQTILKRRNLLPASTGLTG